MTKRKSPVRHKVRTHTRQGKRVFSFMRGHGNPRVQVRRRVLRIKKQGNRPKYVVGDIVKTRSGSMSSPVQAWKITEVYNSIEDYKKRTGKQWWGKEEEGPVYVTDSLSDIRSGVPILEKRIIKKLTKQQIHSIYERRISNAKFVAKKYEKTKYFSHESKLKNLKSVLHNGINPGKTGMIAIPGKYVMFSEASNYNNFKSGISKSSGGKGQSDSIYIVFEKTKSTKHVVSELLKNNKEYLKSRDEWWAYRVEDWFISHKPIPPQKILLVYDNKGNIIYKNPSKELIK